MSLDLRAVLAGDLPEPDRLVCSRRECRSPATRAVLWRNPRIHAEDRRKTWLACAEHEEILRSHLTLRGFPTTTCAVADLPDGAPGHPAS